MDIGRLVAEAMLQEVSGVPSGLRRLPHGHSLTADHLARPPLAHLVAIAKMSDSLSLHSGRYHFFDSRSFKAALSSMASAKSFFSLPFSSCSCFRRFASATSMPPNLLFQL